MAVTADASLVAQRLGEGLAQTDADVLGGVVGVDMQIALGFDIEVDQPVARHLVEHVIEKGNTGLEDASPRAIEVDLDANPGFQGIAREFGLPHRDTWRAWRLGGGRQSGRAERIGAHDNITAAFGFQPSS